MSSERPVKRARQACDQCRRKKSRCPGEKPVCSYCTRLGQQCSYTDEGLQYPRQSTQEPIVSTSTSTVNSSVQMHENHRNSVDTTKRLNDLEAKLSEVLSALHESRQQSGVNQPTDDALLHLQHSTPTRPSPQHNSRTGTLPPISLQHIAETYMSYCHSQPLPLFVPHNFATTLASRDKSVVSSVCAFSLRFSGNSDDQIYNNATINSHLETARDIITRDITTAVIELSTLQALCIISWLDFYNGNTHRASMYASLASDLCKSANLASNAAAEGTIQEEKLRCFWSIVLLQRLHPNISGSFNISFDEDNMPLYPRSLQRPDCSNNTERLSTENRASDHKDLGIIAYAIQLTEVWYKVAHYAHRRASAGPHPPWSAESDYAKIIAHQMHSETMMPYSKHRFKPARFEDRSAEELFLHRAYWSPWLFTQILYHTIICVLNHPLLLSLRLQTFRVASIPEIWLQHTDDLIAQHSQWIIHLIDLMEQKSFLVSDPFLAHCVAIVATIHLQQSFGGDEETQQIKKASFAKCLRFCENMGEKWSSVQQLAQKLRDFERVVSKSYLNSAASQANDKIFVDLNLFWEILESAAISEKPDKGGLTFGQSLKEKARPSITTEQLNARLLPETSRVVAAGSPANGVITQHTPSITNILQPDGQAYPLNDDFNVLAQSYFAQGQDFVGNMDDWWLLDVTNQPL